MLPNNSLSHPKPSRRERGGVCAVTLPSSLGLDIGRRNVYEEKKWSVLQGQVTATCARWQCFSSLPSLTKHVLCMAGIQRLPLSLGISSGEMGASSYTVPWYGGKQLPPPMNMLPPTPPTHTPTHTHTYPGPENHQTSFCWSTCPTGSPLRGSTWAPGNLTLLNSGGQAAALFSLFLSNWSCTLSLPVWGHINKSVAK